MHLGGGGERAKVHPRQNRFEGLRKWDWSGRPFPLRATTGRGQVGGENVAYHRLGAQKPF